jgi:phosphate transporter
MCSGSMSLPMSSFPNMNSLLTTDDFDVPYLKVADFLIHGTPVTIFSLLWLMSIGYGLMHALL